MKIRLGYFVLFILLAFVSLPLLSLFLADNSLGSAYRDTTPLNIWQDAYLRGVILFSLKQAALSTLLSVSLGLLLAWSFAHFGDFPFRTLILGLFGLPLVVPAIVAVLGIVSVYGAQGWLPLGSKLYGLTGILLAHLFFNLPLSVRLLLPIWNHIPDQHWRISVQLGMSRKEQWTFIEWPAIRESLPGISLLIFMLCLTSFAVVLTLGGGPRSTTLEVAIYQSLRFDFDPTQAVILALIQLALSVLLALIAARFSHLPDIDPDLNIHADTRHLSAHWSHALFIFLGVVFIATPLLAMLIDALKGPLGEVLGDANLWRAMGFSILIGLSAAFISISLGWFLLSASAELAYQKKTRMAQLLELSGSVIYVVPPLVIGTGLFILLSKHINVFDWAIAIVILINGLMGLPFVIRTLGPALRQHTQKYQRLCANLNIHGWQRFIKIDLPLLRKPLGLSAALVTAMAMGDLGVIALFGTPQTSTLSLLLYHRLSAYQMPQAAITALILLLSCLLAFWLLERFIGGKSNAGG